MAIGYTDDTHYTNMAEALRKMGHIGKFTPSEMVSRMSIIKFGARTDSIWEWKDFKWSLIHKDVYHGLYYITDELVVGQKYAITYKFKQIDKGNASILRFLGGHDRGFEPYKWTLDGQEMTSNYNDVYNSSSGNSNVANNYNTHEIKYYATYLGTDSDNNFYIQPNRGVVTQVYYEVWDFNIEPIEEFPE